MPKKNTPSVPPPEASGSYSHAAEEEALKEMEKRLRASEERYRTLVEWAPDGVIVQRDGRFLYLNCPALGMYQVMNREELKEKNFLDLVHPEDRAQVSHQLRLIQGGEQMPPHEFRIMRSDGSVVYVEAAGIVIDYEGTPASLFILRDVTERRRREEERHWEEEFLMRQGRLTALGEMIVNMAHQWRQPLNTLGLIVQELPLAKHRGMLTSEHLEESVQKAMRTITQMSVTIDDFRNFFRLDAGSERFRAADAVRRAVALVHPAFLEYHIALRQSLNEELYIDGFPNDFARVVLNILMNARDALLERRPPHPAVALELFSESGKTVITVIDNAGGISEEIMGRIFDPYFTTKGPDRGTGIGLFMSKIVIEKNMSGSLTARNVEGGAQFRIEV